MSLDNLRNRFSGRLLTDPADMAPFLTDWRKLWTGKALAVAQPDSTEGVAAVVRWCAEHRVPVVPQGGNTSMVGGAVPNADGRAKRLNKIRAVDPINNTLTADAGCVLADVMSGPAFRQQEAQINSLVYAAVHRAGGSISAEHGIGQLKIDKNIEYKSAIEMHLMANVKAALDPHGLMNPGRLFPAA